MIHYIFFSSRQPEIMAKNGKGLKDLGHTVDGCMIKQTTRVEQKIEL